MKKNGFAPLILIIVIATIGVIVYFEWAKVRTQNSNKQSPQQSIKDKITKGLDVYCRTKCQFNVVTVKDDSSLAWGTWTLISGESKSPDGVWVTTKSSKDLVDWPTEYIPGKDYKKLLPLCSTPVNNPSYINEEIFYCINSSGEVVLRP